MTNQELEQKVKTRLQQIVNYMLIYFPKLPATEATFNFISQMALQELTVEQTKGVKVSINMDENNQFSVVVEDK